MNESSFGSDILGDEENAADAEDRVPRIQEAQDIHNIQEIRLRAKPSTAPETELAEVSFGGEVAPPVVITKPTTPRRRTEAGTEPKIEATEPTTEARTETQTQTDEVPVEIPSAATTEAERPESTRRRRSRRARSDRRGRGEHGHLRESAERGEHPGSRSRRWQRGGRDEDDSKPLATTQPGPASEARTPSVAVAPVVGQRVAILLDVHELSCQARELDGELAVGRLLRRVGRNRATVRAVAYITAAERRMAGGLRDCGLEVVEVEAGAPAAVQIAVDAMAIGGRVDCVVLAPAQLALAPLATVLRSQGLRVETASFGEGGGKGVEAQQHLTLGEDSLFRP